MRFPDDVFRFYSENSAVRVRCVTPVYSGTRSRAVGSVNSVLFSGRLPGRSNRRNYSQR